MLATCCYNSYDFYYNFLHFYPLVVKVKCIRDSDNLSVAVTSSVLQVLVSK